MPKNNFRFKHSIVLLIVTLLLFFLNISYGTVYIPKIEIFKILTGKNIYNETWEIIILQFRIPKAIMAVVSGMALSISGMQMQTFFRNPIAGPYVLGITSGASMGVAILVLGSTLLPYAWQSLAQYPISLISASFTGSILVLLAVLLVSQKIKNSSALLITGLMFGSFASALVSVLSYFSSAESLQKFTFWSLGNLSNITWNEIYIILPIISLGLLLSFFSLKSLNTLLLGENYAKSLGVNLNYIKILIIISTGILTATITAFAGPIAFIGIAVPHFSKLIFKTSNHYQLYFSCIFIGSCVMLICDMATQIPYKNIVLPINAITSFIGAPVIIWLILYKNNRFT